jgi:tetratricopeptide (TPR) repeat protein
MGWRKRTSCRRGSDRNANELEEPVVSSRKWWVVAILCLLTLPATSEEAMQRASRLPDAGSTRNAKAVLLALLKQEPLNPRAHQLLGDVYQHEGNAKGADREYRRALDLGVRDSELLSSLAKVDKWTRHYSDARKFYRREIEFSPFPEDARRDLEDLEFQRGMRLFSSYGGWETDSTTKGWQTDLFWRSRST